MYCIDDKSKYKIYGSEATDQTGFMMLDVEQCNPEKRPTCNTNQTEFNDYVESLGWLTATLIYNKNVYESGNYGNETVSTVSQLDVYKINLNTPTAVSYKTTHSYIESEEAYVPVFDDPDEYEFFTTTASG